MGGAGCGKTYQLMQALGAHLEAAPLQDGQRVLALTFMHGSRRRLEERLRTLSAIRGRSDCSTIDSFAWRLVQRWRALAAALGYANIEANEHERICDAAGALLQMNDVRGWVAASFPVLLVDEAQDLTKNRLRVIDGLAARLHTFVAADEFQCLIEDLRPNPACVWLSQVCPVEELKQPRRTDVAELLDAAAAIRGGGAPKSGKLFRVELTPKPQLAGAWLSSNLSWYGGGGKSVAIITPTLGSFARAVLAWVGSNKTKKGVGPYSISWEESEAKAASIFLSDLRLPELGDMSSIVALISAAGDPRVARDVAEWMHIQRRTRSKMEFSKEEVERLIERSFIQRRRVVGGDTKGWKGMTVHGAKNREFDCVIVVWPAAIGGGDDQKRRLLYNAVTRAKERCLVLVQAKACLSQAPFA